MYLSLPKNIKEYSIMADNYLENQYENYLARKAAMGKKTAKKKNIIKIQRLQSEAIEALKDIIAVTSAPISISLSSCSKALLNVQNEPQSANPIFFPLRSAINVTSFGKNISDCFSDYFSRGYRSNLSRKR